MNWICFAFEKKIGLLYLANIGACPLCNFQSFFSSRSLRFILILEQIKDVGVLLGKINWRFEIIW